MAGHWFEAAHAVWTESLPQRIDQGGTALRAVALPPSRCFPACGGMGGSEFDLPRRHGFGTGDGKADRFEAETCVLHCAKRFEIKRDKPGNMGNIARRPR